MTKRKQLKEILAKLDESNYIKFRRMYSPTDLTKDINLVVDDMPAKQLSWAIQQCNNSYYTLFRTIGKNYEL